MRDGPAVVGVEPDPDLDDPRVGVGGGVEPEDVVLGDRPADPLDDAVQDRDSFGERGAGDLGPLPLADPLPVGLVDLGDDVHRRDVAELEQGPDAGRLAGVGHQLENPAVTGGLDRELLQLGVHQLDARPRRLDRDRPLEPDRAGLRLARLEGDPLTVELVFLLELIEEDPGGLELLLVASHQEAGLIVLLLRDDRLRGEPFEPVQVGRRVLEARAEQVELRPPRLDLAWLQLLDLPALELRLIREDAHVPPFGVEPVLGLADLGLEVGPLGQQLGPPLEHDERLPAPDVLALADLDPGDPGPRRSGDGEEAAVGLEPPQRRDPIGLDPRGRRDGAGTSLAFSPAVEHAPRVTERGKGRPHRENHHERSCHRTTSAPEIGHPGRPPGATSLAPPGRVPLDVFCTTLPTSRPGRPVHHSEKEPRGEFPTRSRFEGPGHREVAHRAERPPGGTARGPSAERTQEIEARISSASGREYWRQPPGIMILTIKSYAISRVADQKIVGSPRGDGPSHVTSDPALGQNTMGQASLRDMTSGAGAHRLGSAAPPLLFKTWDGCPDRPSRC